MKPTSTEWKPSVSSSSWVPGGNATSSNAVSSSFTVAAPTSTPTSEQQQQQQQQQQQPPPEMTTSLTPTTTATPDGIDENDPLWQAVLKIANGDPNKAEKLLNDPDQLASYPEIESLLLSSSNNGNTEMDEDDNTPSQIHDDNDNDDMAFVDKVQQMKIDNNNDNNTASSPAKGGKTTKVDVVMEEATSTSEPTPAAAAPVAAQEGDPREHLNLVFIGHVDAGKSTLCGNILYLTDNVDKRAIERYEKEAKERNRDSWFLAFIMDTNEEERAKGITVEVGKARFETTLKRYTILDAPGHKNYVPNMIQGASQADVGILVISARKGEFETGFDRGGQTREHAMLAKMLGVSYLVVVVNKMDEPTVQWQKSRFDECVTKIRPYLKNCGFIIKTEVKFIPVSGLGGANVRDEVSTNDCSWWKECYTKNENNTSSPTLLSLLDSLELTGRDPTAPLRIPVLDRYSDRGTIVMGKVESGVIRPGDKVMIMPTRSKFKVDEVYADETPVSGARPGENVLIKLNGAKMDDVRKGYVVCSQDKPCRAVDKLICQISIMDMPESQKIMTAGFNCVFHTHTCEEECTIIKLFETTNVKNQIVKDARFAGIGMRAIVMIELNQTIPVETFDDYNFLGRFTLRTEGKTIAIGKVTKLPPRKE